jgi:vacuolar-type H+-ATPase subunit H
LRANAAESKSFMKEILRRLLEAEEAGRQEAAGLEAAGEELLRQAAAERDALVAQIQLETARQVDELTRETTVRDEDEREAIIRSAAEAVQRLRTEAASRRPAAIDRGVAILLGEGAP